MTENALQSLFRHKSYFLALPSGGKYYKNPPTLKADGDLGIMSMTAADEIKLKSPDALFNGEAMFDLFKSCVPDIVDPKEIPVIDVDAILIAIRLAGGDDEMEAQSTCPSCKAVSPYEIDLNAVLQSIKPKSLENILDLRDNVKVVLKPVTLEAQVNAQIETFHQVQMQRALVDLQDDIEGNAEQSQRIFEQAFVSIIALQINQVASCIERVELIVEGQTEVVTNPDHISEWVRNMTKKDHTAVSQKIQELGEVDINNNMDFVCPECGHSYKNKIDLNPANFF